jgi:hypothetical protein
MEQVTKCQEKQCHKSEFFECEEKKVSGVFFFNRVNPPATA